MSQLARMMAGTTDDVCVAYITIAPADAPAFARSLVEARLAACVNIIPGVTSVYSWKGEVEQDAEALLIVKTRRALQPELEAHLRAHHKYETPELLLLPVEAGSAAYLQWVRDGTKAPGGAGAPPAGGAGDERGAA